MVNKPLLWISGLLAGRTIQFFDGGDLWRALIVVLIAAFFFYASLDREAA